MRENSDAAQSFADGNPTFIHVNKFVIVIHAQTYIKVQDKTLHFHSKTDFF